MLNKGSCEAKMKMAVHVLNLMSDHPETVAGLGLADLAAEAERGWTLLRRAEAAWLASKNKRGDALAAADACARAFAQIRAIQGQLTALARIVITSASDRDRLALSGRRAESLPSWLHQTMVFHVNLTAADRAHLARFGVGAADLADAAARLHGLGAMHARCIAAKAAAKAATEAKAAAFADMAGFMSVIIQLARAREGADPDLARMLGMTRDARRRERPVEGSGEAEADLESVDGLARGGDEASRRSGGDRRPERAEPEPGRRRGRRTGRGRRKRGKRATGRRPG